MKDRAKKIGRFLAGFTAFAVLLGAMTFQFAGEPGSSVTVMEPEQEYMDGSGDMSAMMEQYQQMMGGSDADMSAMMGMMGSGDMSAMMEQYQQMMGGSGDMSAMLEQFMGSDADGAMADLIAQYAGGDLSSLLGGGETEEQEPIEWVTVYIRDMDDWEEFVRNCQLDTWSQDKKVQLKTDLTLEGDNAVPTFGGVFDGEGHTIDGIELEAQGSYRGLFRHVQKGAEIKDLNVSGTVRVSGSWEAVGGIAGENLGTIARCTFDGIVEGSADVGGIAGVNGITGQIVGCSVSGEVSGEHGTGGITGKNSGSLIRCISTADVNTGVESVTPELDDVKLEDIAASENFTACTDVGGIAGYSSGFIQHCISRGNIGYPHTGYNVGGIVGRQTGYVVNCTNHGTVSGRKEVGGIVGQMEPFIQPAIQQSALMGMAASLSELQGKLDGILAGLDNSNQELAGHMTGLNTLTGDAQDSIDNMLENVYEWGGGMVDTVNDLSARLALVIEMAVPMIEDFEETFASLADTIGLAEEAIAELEDMADPAEDLMDEIYDAMDDVAEGTGGAEDAVADLKRSLEYLLGAIGTDEETGAALDQTEAALQDLGGSLKATAEAVGLLADAFAALQEDDIPGWDTDALAEELKAVEDAVDQNHQAAWLFVEGLKALERAIFAESGEDLSDLQDAWGKFGQAVNHLISGGKALADSFEHIRDMIPILEDLGEEVLDASEVFREAMDSLADMSDHISDSMGELAKIFEAQAQYPALEIPQMSDDFLKDSENLSSTVDSMLAEMQALQTSMTDMADDLIDGVRDLVNSFDDLAASLISGLTDSGGELVEDVSEKDTGMFGISMGTVSGCTNLGAVDGDTNTGGIAGSMAVEFSIDPELEMSFESMPMVSVTFQTRAVLKDSISRGAVTGRKDCTGGVVGRAGLGLVTGCTAVADVSGAGYVGGIAGLAETPVRSSWAKGLLSGTGYLGGIAGSASELTDCRAQAQLRELVAFSGAVAGEAETLSGNYYVGSEVGAVDGISYSGKAEPIDMDAFLQLEGVPEAMRTMTVSFVFADGSVETVLVEPGRKLADEDIPDLPPKEGYAGYWDGLEDLDTVEFDTVIRAVYAPRSSTVPSEQTGSGGRPILLVQGGADTPRVELKESSASPELGEKDTFVEGWSFTIPKGSKETTVRYLLPKQEGGTLRLMVRSGGEWTEAEHTVDGSYAVFNVKSGENELACIRTESSLWLWIAIAGGGAALVIVVTVIILKKKKRP